MKKLIMFFVLVTLIPLSTVSSVSASPANDTVNTLIQGTTDFLIERAKDNHFYIFENKLKDNNDFKTYFPITYSYIADGDLKVLLTHKGIWEKAVKNDLGEIAKRAFAESVSTQIDLSKEAEEWMDNYIIFARCLTIDINGKSYRIYSIPLDERNNKIVVDTVNKFFEDPSTLRKELGNLGKYLKKYEKEKNTQGFNFDDLVKKAKKLNDAFKNIETLYKFIEKNKDRLTFNPEMLKTSCPEESELIICRYKTKKISKEKAFGLIINEEVLSVIKKAQIFDNYMQVWQQDESNTEKVIKAMRFIEDIGLVDHINLDKLKRYALFFAQLSEVENKEQVKAILTEYTLPAVSFFIKREKKTFHLLITSYFGYAYGKDFDTPDDSKDNNHGITAPIGLELSYGLCWGDSISLLLAPVDFGYPVTLRMNGIEEELSFDDIFSPGIFAAYGIRDMPLNFGIGYQRGRRIGDSDDVENRFLGFISYDMPLYTFH